VRREVENLVSLCASNRFQLLDELVKPEFRCEASEFEQPGLPLTQI
jgi:hypothetical protein